MASLILKHYKANQGGTGMKIDGQIYEVIYNQEAGASTYRN